MRRVLQVTLVVLTLVVGAASAGVIISQTMWFKNWLRGYIVREANQYLNGQVSIQRLGGNLFYGIELENVGVSMDGREVVSVHDLGLKYSVFELISKGLSVDDIRLNQPVLYLRREGDGWSISRLIKREQQEADRQGPQSPIAVDDIGITDASVIVDDPVGTSGVEVPKRVDKLDAQLSFHYEPVHYSIDISHFSFRGTDPAIGVNGISGSISVKDDALFFDQVAVRTEESSMSIHGDVQQYLTTPQLHLQVSSDKLSIPEIARVIPALAGIAFQPAFELTAAGPLDALAIDMNVRSSAGDAIGKLTADLLQPRQAVKGELSVRHLNLAPIVKDPAQKTDLTGNARVDLRAANISDLDSIAGQVTVDAPRLVAMNHAVERVHADVKIAGRRISVNGRAAAYGTEATASGTVTLANAPEPLSYDLSGRARGLDLARMPADLKLPPAPTSLNAEYHVRGREPQAGSSLRSREVDADIRFADSTVAGAMISGGSTAAVSMREDDLTARADVTIGDLDLERLGREFAIPAITDERYRSAITGHIAANAAVSNASNGLTLDNVTGTVQADLQPSQIGDLAIESARIDSDYRDRSADIRELAITGRDLKVTANGQLALGESGDSNLTFHADSPDLREVGRLANVDVSGIGRIDGTLTGNQTELHAKGTLSLDAIQYGDVNLLTAESKYEAKIPDLAVDRVQVTADTHATFLTIADQNINELTARTNYADQQLEFDAVARQPQRSLTAGGALALHPDHQEVHLQRLSLDTQGMQWQLAPESDATIRYADQAVTIDNLKLVSGDQQVTATGTFGPPDGSLDITFSNVDLKSVDAALMRPSQFTGRLNASGTVTGTTADPHVHADFQVRQGAFRQFTYDTFGGAIDYSKAGVTVDSRLQQNATQWISAKGTLPVTLFSGTADESPVDLTIDSSPIDLGIVQGFTTDLTNVTGTLEAHVRLTGAANDPHPDGAISIRNGAMNVVPTNVAYSHIAGKIDLHPDRVHIDELTVLDNHQASVSITGDVAIHERQLGDVHLYVAARDFKVIDNKLGTVRVESALEVNGGLTAPRLEGYFGISTGKIDLDEIIAKLGTSPYATKQTEFVTRTASVEPPPSPGIFDRLNIDVQFYVPNDFVIRSKNLQAPDSPIGLGALNVTLGGDLRAFKEPGGELQMYGQVNTVRGSYDFQGRRFDIMRDGSVRFDGTNLFDPVLDLRTQRVITGVETHVTVRGTLQHPEIDFSSSPPLERADILALIVFNQPMSQLGTGDQISLAQRAEALAVGALAGQIASSIGTALNLDTFEIAVAPETGQAAQLTIGQQVSRDLYFKVEQSVGEMNQTVFILEYELTNWLRLRTNVLQGSSTQQSLFRRSQDTGVDLLFFFSY